MVILLILILLVMLGAISFEGVTTVAGGVIAGVILLIYFIFRRTKRR